MMEKYFAFKYYEEVVGTIISIVVLVGMLAIPIFTWLKDLWKKWGEK